MYADFDHRYRPRPLRWSIALVSFCQFILGVTITNALVSIGDVAVLRAAPNMPDSWVIYATPWLTLVLIGSSLFVLAMMAFTVWGDRGLLAMWRTQHDLDRLVREIEIVEQKNATLAREVQRLRSDLGYIEKIAREELGLVRPGEIVFEFAD